MRIGLYNTLTKLSPGNGSELRLSLQYTYNILLSSEYITRKHLIYCVGCWNFISYRCQKMTRKTSYLYKRVHMYYFLHSILQKFWSYIFMTIQWNYQISKPWCISLKRWNFACAKNVIITTKKNHYKLCSMITNSLDTIMITRLI
jgi:hypothetical protein